LSETKISELRFAASPAEGDVSAILVDPPGATSLVVLGHGAGAGMRHRFMDGITAALAELGIATFRYQFPYVEAGRRRPDRKQVLTATVRSAVAAATEIAPDRVLFAGGKSMGGRMTSTAQAESALPGIRGIVFLGFPLHRPGDPSDARADHLREIEIPMLFVQGTRDRLAELDRMEHVVKDLGSGSRLHRVVDADHGFDVLKGAGKSAAEVYLEMAAAVRRWADDVRA